jgi:hypothetical protein
MSRLHRIQLELLACLNQTQGVRDQLEQQAKHMRGMAAAVQAMLAGSAKADARDIGARFDTAARLCSHAGGQLAQASRIGNRWVREAIDSAMGGPGPPDQWGSVASRSDAHAAALSRMEIEDQQDEAKTRRNREAAAVNSASGLVRTVDAISHTGHASASVSAAPVVPHAPAGDPTGVMFVVAIAAAVIQALRRERS